MGRWKGTEIAMAKDGPERSAAQEDLVGDRRRKLRGGTAIANYISQDRRDLAVSEWYISPRVLSWA